MTNKWDIIIVGAGTTGLPAAIKAAERGAKILVVDAAPSIGGTLHLSSGSLSAAGTSLQEKKGIKDTPEQHLADSLNINHGTGEVDKLALWQENSSATLEWLLSLGLKYPETQPVKLAGHEPYDIARITTPKNGGRGYIQVLEPFFNEIIKTKDVELRLNTRMVDILVDKNKAVIGIETENNGTRDILKAKTVLLACGGYANSELLWKELHERPKRVYAYPHSLGDGLLLSRKLGARVQLQENLITTFGGTIDIDKKSDYWIHTKTSPQMRPPWEIFVNNQGKRFFNEENISPDFRERTIMNQPDWSCWLIYDENIRKKAPELFTSWNKEKISRAFETHPDYCKASTIQELAALCNLPEAPLQATIQHYNLGRQAKSDPWGRQHTPSNIDTGPFYAIKHYAISVVSFGGIVCDNNLRILNKTGQPIPNLFGGGELLGMGIWGNAYLGGSSVGGCLTMGRLLGEKLLTW